MIITLITDFGTADHYAAVMKGVILSGAPQATIVDISHHIPPQDVGRAAFLLHMAWRYFPAGTVHTAVVDPGVGTDRRVLAAEAEGHFFLAPDNGLLSWVRHTCPGLRVRSVENRELFRPGISSVFHGRDIFSPVAAFLASGGDWADVGPVTASIVKTRIPLPESDGNRVSGVVVYVDAFGNCITNIPGTMTEGRTAAAAECGGHTVSRSGSVYADAEAGEAVLLTGSHGYLEMSVRNGSAAAVFSIDAGSPVSVILK
ncbi:SAM-dependent chlorinase/fluorinase [bacterium]|nr:SAM-dependent chlorinase/fluorinase [bacterium]